MKGKILVYMLLLGVSLFCFTMMVKADSISIISDSDDGHVENNGAVYGTVHDAGSGSGVIDGLSFKVGQDFIGQFYIYRAVLFFNTSVLDVDVNNVSSVNLRFYISGDSSIDDFNIIATYPDVNKSLTTGDYNYTLYSGNYGNYSTQDLQPRMFGYAEIELSRTWIDTYLNFSGFTRIGLRSDNDINSVVPSTLESMDILSSDSANDRYKPQLRISYNNYTSMDSSSWINYTGTIQDANCSVRARYWQVNNTLLISGFNIISSKSGTGAWVMVSLPKNETVDKTEIYVRNATNNYTWNNAVANGIILTFLYNFSGGYYNQQNFTPYQGYWLWFYDTNYSLWINGTANDGVTYLDYTVENEGFGMGMVILFSFVISIAVVAVFMPRRKNDK